MCTLLLSCLFVYDVFWVFVSPRFFGESVMVTVATKQSNSPIQALAHTLHILLPAVFALHLDLPVKLLVPRSLLNRSQPTDDFLLLGLGDVALPGMQFNQAPFDLQVEQSGRAHRPAHVCKLVHSLAGPSPRRLVAACTDRLTGTVMDAATCYRHVAGACAQL